MSLVVKKNVPFYHQGHKENTEVLVVTGSGMGYDALGWISVSIPSPLEYLFKVEALRVERVESFLSLIQTRSLAHAFPI